MDPKPMNEGSEEEEDGAAEMIREGKLIYIHREAAVCEEALEKEVEWSGIVHAELNTAGAQGRLGARRMEFIAFPPGSDFDMYKLKLST